MYPGDNWRFYPDAAQSLAFWSNKEYRGRIDKVIVEEVFILRPITYDYWDHVSVYKKVDQPTTEIVTPIEVKEKFGPLKNLCIASGLSCVWTRN